MNDQIRPQPGILDIALYEGGKAHVAGVANVVKLSSNENPFGPSDRAKEAFARAVQRLHRYPVDRPCRPAQAIAEVHGLDPARIICGVGLGRDHHLPLPGLCRAEGRGGLHRTRLPDVPHLGPGRGGDPGRGARARADGGCRCDPGGLQPAHQAGVHRQPEQPDRHDDLGRPRSSGWPQACRRRRFWCWTGPMPNMSRAMTAARRWSTRATTW